MAGGSAGHPVVMNRTIRRLAIAVLAAFAAAACGGSTNQKVGLIGDSITDMSRGPLQQALGSGHKVEIDGKFGARSDQVIEDVKLIAASRPGAAIINIGTNDAIQQIPAKQTAANIQQILDLLKDVGCRYLVQINEGITDKATAASRQAEAHAINQQLAALADKNGVDVIDWNRTIANNGGNGVITFDTIHLTDKGVLLMAAAYKKALDAC